MNRCKLLMTLAALVIFTELTLWEAGILAAILAPTDAGLGQVIVNSPRVPERIRQSLNVEAGLNDGISVPFLMFFIALSLSSSEGAGSVLTRFVLEQLGLGVLVGVFERSAHFPDSLRYEDRHEVRRRADGGKRRG